MKTEEMQLGLQMSLSTQNQSLRKEMADTKKDLHGELNLSIQGTQAVIQ
jgi:hypothetical protein